MSNKLQLFLLWALVIGLCVFAVRTDFAAFNLNKRDRKSTRLNSSHIQKSRMPSSA